MKKIGIYKIDQNNLEFSVWAPKQNHLKIKFNHFVKDLKKDQCGYFSCVVPSSDIKEGDLYYYVTDSGNERPDPASSSQPKGVHGPSEVIFHDLFQWEIRNFSAPQISDLIIYEIHPGTFTAKGNFEGVKSKISHLKDLGINAIEIMPVSSFPGKRNWGYDGVHHFSVQESYGGPTEFKKLIDECHKENISVILDVVYNHLGPEGNYLFDYGHYFTDKYKTPWGWAINFDDAYSDEVRNYFFQNALHWCHNYKIDGLRLDAIHAIYDFSATHFLRELKGFLEKHGYGHVKLIAESDLNDPVVIRSREKGGHQLDSQWSDDFHHVLHTLLTGEKLHYYQDFGKLDDFKKILTNGFVYDGEYSLFRKRKHGGQLTNEEMKKLVVSFQNHDQVGNRPLGDRLTTLVSKEKFFIGQAILLLSPFIPMLFMGDEIFCQKPFYYFTDHGDQNLIEGVREGRKREFKDLFEKNNFYPDPQDEKTFKDSTIDWEKVDNDFLEKIKSLINLRKKYLNLLTNFESQKIAIDNDNKKVTWERFYQNNSFLVQFCLKEKNEFIQVSYNDKRIL